MKRAFLVLVAVFLLGNIYGQNKTTGFVNRWDVGISVGGLLYSDIAGYQGMIETRAYLLKTAFNVNAFAGAGGLYANTKNPGHNLTDIYGYALVGADWYLLKKAKSTLAPLSLRAQLMFGGGYASDINGEDKKTGSPLLLFYPAIGANYDIKKTHVSLMFGYRSTINDRLKLAGMTIGLGASYSILNRSGK